MSSVDGILIAIILILVARDVLQAILTQKLVNKVMSRNYHDYEFSKNVSKTMEPDKLSLKDGLRAEADLGEDLSPIASFGLN